MALEHTIAYLLLGSNLGDREELLLKARVLIEQNIGKVIATSSLYETAAWGKLDQPAFLNQAIGVETALEAIDVLDKALEIELQLGRVRFEKWGERVIDIDLVLFGSEIIDMGEKLQVPHPHMQNRRFVMEPLAEIAGELIHPVLEETIAHIAENVADSLTVKKI
ncbi:2-amino-4-hydroxy-6-hydroxymethyldihydropteridine diphosphokinase [Pedobacter sp. MW01-1-1]|uniref:2-amino-4-hydroxy-6- hydroxymethyldihydropteridine diphosphokinase n=1 Tax=Pedobacter sp. MW01-1-1 TaxID=3383027 RepID=UPI003FF02270